MVRKIPGLFIGTFFHIFAHDETGFLGTTLRGIFKSIGDGALLFGLNDVTYAHVITAGFMQFSGIFMLPDFLGPTFNPIVDPLMWLGKSISATFPVENLPELEPSPSKPGTDKSTSEIDAPASKKKKKRKKKMA